jgi:hypothetical protein
MPRAMTRESFSIVKVHVWRPVEISAESEAKVQTLRGMLEPEKVHFVVVREMEGWRRRADQRTGEREVEVDYAVDYAVDCVG